VAFAITIHLRLGFIFTKHHGDRLFIQLIVCINNEFAKALKQDAKQEQYRK
jgi:hypothetical protein